MPTAGTQKLLNKTTMPADKASNTVATAPDVNTGVISRTSANDVSRTRGVVSSMNCRMIQTESSSCPPAPNSTALTMRFSNSGWRSSMSRATCSIVMGERNGANSQRHAATTSHREKAARRYLPAFESDGVNARTSVNRQVSPSVARPKRAQHLSARFRRHWRATSWMRSPSSGCSLVDPLRMDLLLAYSKSVNRQSRFQFNRIRYSHPVATFSSVSLRNTMR